MSRELIVFGFPSKSTKTCVSKVPLLGMQAQDVRPMGLLRASTTVGTHDDRNHHDASRENVLLFIMVKEDGAVVKAASCSDVGPGSRRTDGAW